MTTSSKISVLPSRPVTQPRNRQYAPGSLRFDSWIALLSSIFIAGVFLDGWAHNNIQALIDTFFTPYHGALYGGFFLVAGLLTFTLVRNVLQGYAWAYALPPGYQLALTGVLVFLVGGVGDLLWHELFGFEADVEALLSPTHLLLATGAALFVTAPLRAAWQRPSRSQEGWRELWPALLALTGLISLLTFFLQYATYARPDALIDRPLRDSYFQSSAGIFAQLMPTLLITGAALFWLRRWRMPVGGFTLFITANYTLMFLMTMKDSFKAPWSLVATVVAGVVIDLLYQQLQPDSTHLTAMRRFAFLTSFAISALYMLSMLLTQTLWWPIHMWAGIPFLSGVAGLFLSFVAYPPTVPTVE